MLRAYCLIPHGLFSSFVAKLGDYGTVDKETGAFIKHNNIYKDEKTDTSGLERTSGAPDDKYNILSVEVREVNFNVKPEAYVASCQGSECRLIFAVRFRGSRMPS